MSFLEKTPASNFGDIHPLSQFQNSFLKPFNGISSHSKVFKIISKSFECPNLEFLLHYKGYQRL
jgi:hypothetical protein